MSKRQEERKGSQLQVGGTLLLFSNEVRGACASRWCCLYLGRAEQGWSTTQLTAHNQRDIPRPPVSQNSTALVAMADRMPPPPQQQQQQHQEQQSTPGDDQQQPTGEAAHSWRWSAPAVHAR